VIGGDLREKKFYPVTNAEEFDPANLSKILSAYLEPLPLFHSYRVTSDEGEPFVLIVLESNQPSPVVIVKQGKAEKGKTRPEVGEVWLKKNTDTIRATRADLDRMYKVRSEEEAEDRARKRVNHLLELLPSGQPQRTSATVLPSFDLIVGPKNGLRKFVAELLATDDERRFKMLLELCRETLVEGWDNFQVSDLSDGLDSVVEIGLIGIKHNVGSESLKLVVDLLVEAFDSARRLVRFQRYGGANNGQFPNAWWRPACVLRELKTKKSRTAVPITQETAAILLSYLKVWRRANPQDLQFPNRRGRPCKRANVVKFGLHPILRQLGLPTHRAGLHAFRHGLGTAATSPKTAEVLVNAVIVHVDLKFPISFLSSHRGGRLDSATLRALLELDPAVAREQSADGPQMNFQPVVVRQVNVLARYAGGPVAQQSSRRVSRHADIQQKAESLPT
jgi:hypothetical protein